VQPADSAPPTQAAATASSCASEQTFWSCGVIGVAVPAGHRSYGAGHVLCWLLQRRGSTSPLQNEFEVVQFVHSAPF
jgi:hypothetical protein